MYQTLKSERKGLQSSIFQLSIIRMLVCFSYMFTPLIFNLSIPLSTIINNEVDQQKVLLYF